MIPLKFGHFKALVARIFRIQRTIGNTYLTNIEGKGKNIFVGYYFAY